MDRGGNSGAGDGFPMDEDPFGTDDPSGGVDPFPGGGDPFADPGSFATGAGGPTADGGAPRQWTHPSEVGLQARVHTDRRRGRALVIGLVAFGAVVMLATATLTNVFDRRGSAARAAMTPEPLEECLAMVEMLGADGSTHTTGLLVDEGRHVVVAGDGLHRAERIAVRIGGARTTGVVVARDAYVDLAVLRLEAPSGTRPAMAPDPGIGDTLRLVRFDGDGHRRSTTAQVAEVSMTWPRPDHTVVADAMALTGAESDTGVLTGHDGAVAGLVIGNRRGQPIAYASTQLQHLVDQMMEQGTVEHPWIGVRVRDRATSGVSPTGAAASAQGHGAEVIEVVPGSPAQDAGLLAGDVIRALDDTPVDNMADLVRAVAPLQPGHVAEVSLVRGEEAITSRVEVATFPG